MESLDESDDSDLEDSIDYIDGEGKSPKKVCIYSLTLIWKEIYEGNVMSYKACVNSFWQCVYVFFLFLLYRKESERNYPIWCIFKVSTFTLLPSR
jgi:hypothetical protein